MRYRLDVVAPSVVEVVTAAGGWLFDRVMAGWDVTVLVDGNDNSRPLQILGVQTGDLEDALRAGQDGPRPDALAVAAEVYGSDERVRHGVQMALAGGNTEVTMWGRVWPSELTRSVGDVEHRLSVAARAFKAQALAAASAPQDRVGDIEAFRTGMALCCPIAADLVPAS